MLGRSICGQDSARRLAKYNDNHACDIDGIYLSIGSNGAQLQWRDDSELLEVPERHNVEVDIVTLDDKRLAFELE